MKKSILHNKKGVTVLEGLIALGLLSMVAAGAFAVLLSSARQTSQPDFREEMLLAVEKANDALQQYVIDREGLLHPDTYMEKGLCPNVIDTVPLSSTFTHHINCMLPAICDRNGNRSSFSYTVSTSSQPVKAAIGSANKVAGFDDVLDHLKINYKIQCNGYTL